MANEKTPLLNGFVINIPINKDLPIFGDLRKGLSLEELMPFDSDPWWQNLRRTLMSLFWTLVIVMLTSGCIIAALDHYHVHCSAKSSLMKRQIADGFSIFDGANSTASVLPNIAAIGL